VSQVHVFCTDCGHQAADVDQVVVIAYWDVTAKYRFECPSCEQFRTNPANNGKALALVHAGCDVLVEPIDVLLLEAAAVAWWGDMR
jgi:hypothetical protein